MYKLDGKIALVTGAAGRHGIGRAIAMRLAREGADVAVADIRDESTGAFSGLNEDAWGGLSQVASEIAELGRGSLGCVADVTKSDDVARMIAETLDRFGRIDILVNNAGSTAGPDRVPVVELEEDVWDRVQAVNAKGTFLCSRGVARHMIERGGGGKIINLASSAGKQGRGDGLCGGHSSKLVGDDCAHQFRAFGIGPALHRGETRQRLDQGIVDRLIGVGTVVSKSAY